MSRRYVFVAAAALGAAQSVRAAVFAPYLADSYTQGTIYDSSGDVDTYDMSFNNPAVVGDPTSSPTAGLTDIDYGYPEIISPFDPPADADQIVTIGYGGQITLKFPQPINVQKSAPIVGVFTAVGLIDSQYPNGVATDPAALFGAESAFVSVSADGNTWVNLGLQTLNIPENYYSNAGNPYQFPAPSPAELADFGQPFTGTLDCFDGENFSQILATLNGSAGGTWLDLSGTGLSQINFIQFSEPIGETSDTSFVALEAVSANDASVPEPASSIALLAIGGLFCRRVRRSKGGLFLLALISGLFTFASVSRAVPVDSIQFLDGNVLNVQGTYGSGADSAYLVIDFNNADVNYAWQFNWIPGTTVNGWQMMQDIAGESILSTSGTPGTTDVSNPTGDPNLSVTATYYPSYTEHFIANMQDGSTLGNNDDWDFYAATYMTANLSATDPQGIPWVSSGVGIDDVSLSNNEFIGWVDVFPHPPNPSAPETSVPEPGSATGLLGLACLLFRRRNHSPSIPCHHPNRARY